MNQKVTIKDIAEKVGVSKATISHYINGNFSKMSDKTRLKIKAAIEETNYYPSMVAKVLATNDYRMIGVVIADITNPFISTIMKGIHDVCREQGYAVNFTNSDNDVSMEMENIKRLEMENVSGLILDSVSPNNPIIKDLSNQNTVMVDRQSTNTNLDTVVSDNKNSTYKMVKKMQQKEYKNIYFVSYPINEISTRKQRYLGFKEATEQVEDSHLLIINNKKDLKNDLITIMGNKEGKIGFFTMNGPVLLDFMEIMMSLKYSYPEDYGVATYEDLEWMKVIQPGISCIKQDSYQMGREAAKRLLMKIKKSKENRVVKNVKVIEIPTEIIERNSF